MRTDSLRTYGPGTKAYYDTLFDGLVPCVVREVHTSCRGNTCGFKELTIEITETCGAYRKGELLQKDAVHVVPHPQVKRKAYGTRINTLYRYMPTPRSVEETGHE